MQRWLCKQGCSGHTGFRVNIKDMRDSIFFKDFRLHLNVSNV